MVAATAALGATVACGSRGPLDVEVLMMEAGVGPGVTEPDAGVVDGGAGLADAGADARDASRDAPAEGGRFDSGFGPIVDCPVCIGQQCGTQLGACFQDTSCRTVLQCAFTRCVFGDGGGGGVGGFNPTCLLGCANGDVAALAKLYSAFQCVTTKCGPDCASLLGQ